MKRNLLIAFFLLVSVGLANAQVSYGLKAGMNLAKYNKPILSGMEDFEKTLPSFYVTGFVDLPVAPQFSIQPALSLQGKGAKYKGDVAGSSGTIKANVMSLEIPVNAVYYIPAGPGSVFLGAGPYAGLNLSGQVKITGTDNNGDAVDQTEDIEFSGDDKSMERFDYGLNFMLGYKLSNGFLINGGYNLGLADLSAQEGQAEFKNRVISFGIGYQF